MKARHLVTSLAAIAAVFMVTDVYAAGKGACDGSGAGNGKRQQRQTCTQAKDCDGTGAGQQARKGDGSGAGQQDRKRDGSGENCSK